MDRVLVTGGVGFIGFHLAAHLLEQGYEVTVVDNLFRSKRDLEFAKLEKEIRFVQADLTQPLTQLPLDQEYRYVYHLAAINGVAYANNMPHKVLRTNLLSTVQVLDWCAERQPETVLFASSSETYHGAAQWGHLPIPTREEVPLVIADPDIPRYSYAGSKIVGELITLNYAKQYNFAARIVRYHNVYGPRMGFDHVIPQWISRILGRENPFRVYGPNQTRAFCYVSDAVSATYRIGTLPGGGHHIVNVGNPEEEINMEQLCRRLFAVAGYQAPFDYRKAPLGSPDRRCPDITLLSSLLGPLTFVPLTDGLARTYAWYEQYLGDREQ
ncbi:NAD-dependent epimerase/dehydratase family protein [Brevibacillus humidisoli]|uniref:NAD-dependent epimerase/dehydratase family protein n=1 Tax=Brevibacillus humidisoli TaxID=2895522 RepID=UPI001E502883|nr:NAD-dependent epimerase/dehydratase family protein [Brevibacillus humidisoli]UFJ42438.1 NAD-dependent epimerase/dehydratase family protein [Brevibacillus humidisoli]